MTSRVWRRGASLVLAASLLVVGCEEDSPEDGNGNGGGTTAGGTTADGGTTRGATADVDLTLVGVTELDSRNPIAEPHQVIVTNSETGEPIPGFEDPVVTTAVTGKLRLENLPTDVFADLHVVGTDTAANPTYDTISANVPHGSGETLLRVGLASLKLAAERTGGYTGDQELSAAAGAVYWTPGGPGNERQGTIGCAELFLDDNPTATDEDTAQRYIDETGLPVPLSVQAKTDTSGRFYFGNLPKGTHTLKVSLDGGETFVAEQTFQVAYAREDAIGPDKTILYLLGVDVDADANPTAASCDGVY